MTTRYNPMTILPETAPYKKGDILIVVGELFGRGYANGLIEEASRLGMTIIGSTVGRRDSDGSLRPLTAEELSESEALLGGRIINVPLEAGFDMEAAAGLPSISEQLKKVKGDEWQNIDFSEAFLQEAKNSGTARFRSNLAAMLKEASEALIPRCSLHIAHTMAGGIPRARVFMPLLNRIFKGTGEKYLASSIFWDSALGRLCESSFNEVTADTFRYLIEESAGIRQSVETAGGSVSYSAYGYHGTEVLVGDDYRWQSYTPYVQGIAKIRLETIAAEYQSQGISATVFNCPEIQTNSSALFLGVEISLYPLLKSIKAAAPELSGKLFEKCQQLLKDGETVETLLAGADRYLSSPILAELVKYESWPQHNTLEQAELMLNASTELMGMHSDQKQLVCAELSRIVFEATGKLMIHASYRSTNPVYWLNHDIIARLLAV